jgi:hypothetical protein
MTCVKQNSALFYTDQLSVNFTSASVAEYECTNIVFYSPSEVLSGGRRSAPITRDISGHVESHAVHAQLALQHHELLAHIILLVLYTIYLRDTF